MLTKKLKILIPLPYTFNVKNTVKLLNDLLEIPYDQNLKFASFDITNMYSNVPANELIKTVDIMCEKHGISEELKHEIMKLSQIIIKQNYFQFQNTLYIQEGGLGMSAPTSSIFSEICLQHIENTIIADILLKYDIVGYFRYVNNILIVLNKDTTNIYDVFNAFSIIMPTMKFTIEEEKTKSTSWVLPYRRKMATFPSTYTGNQQQQILLFQTTLVIPVNIN
jgi:hypothetical protein